MSRPERTSAFVLENGDTLIIKTEWTNDLVTGELVGRTLSVEVESEPSLWEASGDTPVYDGLLTQWWPTMHKHRRDAP
jgi:hypothetical protein